MSSYHYYSALKLTWREAAELIGEIVQRKTMRQMQFNVRKEDFNYWGFSVIGTQLTLDEINLLLDSVECDEEMRMEAIPTDSDASSSIGMSLSRKLLMQALGMEWEEECITDTALWLINVKE